MATAGNATVTETTTELFAEKRGCTAFLVQVLAASPFGVLVNVPGLHDSADWFPVPVGGTAIFRRGQQGITNVFAKGDGGNATINYGVVSRLGS